MDQQVASDIGEFLQKGVSFCFSASRKEVTVSLYRDFTDFVQSHLDVKPIERNKTVTDDVLIGLELFFTKGEYTFSCRLSSHEIQIYLDEKMETEDLKREEMVEEARWEKRPIVPNESE